MKRLAVILLAVYAAAFLALSLLGVQRDSARFQDAPPPQAAHFLGPSLGYRLDFGAFLSPQELFSSLPSRPFAMADGRRPNLGLRIFEGGYVWFQTDLTHMQPGGPWMLWIDDRYARAARLVLRHKDGSYRVQDWELGAEDRNGLMRKVLPTFALDPVRDRGATAFIAFSSFGGLKGEVYLAPLPVFEEIYTWRMMYLSFLNGVVGALAVYLGAIGLRLGEKSFLYAAGLAFFLMVRNTVETGALYSMLLPRNMVLADVIYYATQPVGVSFWLLFTRSFIRLADRAPRLDALLVFIALILPLQGLLVVVKGGFWPTLPFNTSAALPTFLGFFGGFSALIWCVLTGNRRALWFMLGWLPLAIGLSLRMLSYLVTAWQPDLGVFARMGPDLAASMLALAVILTIDLRQREGRLTRIAETNSQRARDWADFGGDGVIEVAADGIIRHAAGPLARRLDLMPGKAVAQALTGLDSSIARQMIQDPVRGVEFIQGQDAQSRPIWLRLSSTPIAAQDGEAGGFRASVSDISDAVSERDLAARRNTLAAMGQLTGEIAHEVNNLLHPIISLSRRLMDRHIADAEGKRLAGLVVASGLRAGEIVRQVMRAYAPAGLLPTPRALAEAVTDSVETLAASLPSTVTLHSQIDPSLTHPQVGGGEMLQVLSNLASNSVRAMQGVGDLSVTLLRDQGRIVLTVGDRGQGMSDTLRATVLEPFVTTGGIGFGLSIVRRIVQNWGARLDIQSRCDPQDHGTEVMIFFPENGAP